MRSITSVCRDGSRVTIYRFGKSKIRVVSRENDLSRPMSLIEKIKAGRKYLPGSNVVFPQARIPADNPYAFDRFLREFERINES